MDFRQVVQRNRVLALSGALLDTLGTYLSRALNVNDPVEINDVVHLDQVVVEVEIDLVLSLV